MSAYVVVQIEVHDPEEFEKYKTLVSPTIEAYGGRYAVRGGILETLEGDWNPSRMVILEFDSVSQAKAWWSSEEYRVPKQLRHRAASSQMIVVEGT
jgi:uncharacterized protein (DUF1330 family)